MAEIDTTNPRWMLELGDKRINNHTDEEICQVIKKIPWALQFIKSPKPEWLDVAFKHHYQAIGCVENPPVELQRRAVEHHTSAVAFIENLDEELAISLLEKDPNLLHQIKNPTPLMVSVAKILI